MTALYRHFSATGELLYVGISCKPITRLKQHEHDASWAAQITRVEIEKFADRAAALQAERDAIKKERPKHNVMHTSGAPKCREMSFKLGRSEHRFSSPVELARFLRSCAVAAHKGEMPPSQCALLFRWLKRERPAVWQRTMSLLTRHGHLASGDESTMLKCGVSFDTATDLAAKQTGLSS
jgi:predicted GIY-YIG superfamily endonuclease